jgi:hypothetical protein
MPSQDHHSGPPARPVKVTRRQAEAARARLAAGGLTHDERRQLHKVAIARDTPTRRKASEGRHLLIVIAGAAVAMAIVAVSFGLVPAVRAAFGQGTRGTFTLQYETYSRRIGGSWVGTFRSVNGEVVAIVDYDGDMPLGAHQGTTVPALYPGGEHQVYAVRGSHAWISDLGLTLVVGAAVGFLLWLSPLGLRRRAHASGP